MDALKYPTGRFDWNAEMTPATRAAAIGAIAELPARLDAALAGLDRAQLATPYRPDGWTVTQVAHHLADSHLNGYIRLKFGLTEDRPTVRAYDENKWAVLADTTIDPAVSLRLLEALHTRWTALLKSMSPDDFAREVDHTQYGLKPIDRFIHLYGWHSRHHVAHITKLRERQRW